MQSGPPSDLIFTQRTEIELLRKALGFQGSSYIVETELRELRRENRTLRSDLELLSCKLDAQVDPNPSQMERETRLKEKLRKAKLDRTELSADLKKQMAENQALQLRLCTSERRVQEADTQGENMTKERAQLRDLVERATSSMTALEEQLSYTQHQLKQQSQEIVSANSAREKLTLLQAETADANSNLNLLLGADRGRIQELLLERVQLQEAHTTIEHSLQSKSTEIELSLKQKTQEAETLLQQKTEAQANHQRAQTELAATQTELEATGDRLRIAVDSLEELKRTLADRSSSLETLKTSEERLRATLLETENRAQQNADTMSELQKTVQSREETLQSNQLSFETQLESLRQESASLKAKLAGLSQQLLSDLVGLSGLPPDTRTWEAATNALSNRHTDFIRLQTQRMELVDQLTLSERKLQEAEKGIQEFQSLVHQMENVPDSSSSKHDVDASLAERMNIELQNMRATHTGQVKDLLQQVAVVEAKLAACDSHQLEILNLRAENEYLLKQSQEAREANSGLSTLCESLRGELQASKAQNQSPQKAIPTLLPNFVAEPAVVPASTSAEAQPNLGEALDAVDKPDTPTRRTPRRRTRNEPPATPSQPSQAGTRSRRTPTSKASQNQPTPAEPTPGKRRTASSVRDSPPKRIRSEKTGILNNATETPLIANRAPVVMASGLKESQRLEMIDIVTRLGGTARTTPVFDREITHVVGAMLLITGGLTQNSNPEDSSSGPDGQVGDAPRLANCLCRGQHLATGGRVW